MEIQYRCGNPARRLALSAPTAPNAIDYLEVLDSTAHPGTPRQQTLLVRLFKPVPAGLSAKDVRITGGVRITGIQVLWVAPADNAPGDPVTTAAERVFYADRPAADHVLVVRLNAYGDYSSYVLELPETFDQVLRRVGFSFKVECPTDFDCRVEEACPPEPTDEPLIDYLAKDYASFRRLMLARLAATIPGWTERSPADIGMTLVELLAYAADHLSYFQDAVATEAYLDTARQRISVRRHARLLDYFIDEGSNARTWVQLATTVERTLKQGTPLLTRLPQRDEARVATANLPDALKKNPIVFELLHPLTVHPGLHDLRFYAWGDEACCLPKGATRATLLNPAGLLAPLAVGDCLLFEEVLGPDTQLEADADPTHRHVVRLTEVVFTTDVLFSENVVEIAWAQADALPFPLCLTQKGSDQIFSVARGNMALADHGYTLAAESLSPVPEGRPYRPVLTEGPLTWAPTFSATAPATAATASGQATSPCITLTEVPDQGRKWAFLPDLLGCDRFEPAYVVEMHGDGRAQLRFGEGEHGLKPQPDQGFRAIYRIGGGLDGHIGAEALAHVVSDEMGITQVRNPLPATGARAPERLQQVRLHAPQAFRRQERAVTADDYARLAERHPEVQKAAATMRWTGSWYTVFVTVDRRQGLPVDARFERTMARFLEPYRLAGYDLEIDPPRFVALDIALVICVHPSYFMSDVELAVRDVLSARVRRDGSLGFFHPDRYTFGQPVYLSAIVAALMAVPGVRWVQTESSAGRLVRFQRFGKTPNGELEAGLIPMDRLEIARLDNDPNAQENGVLELMMEGGQ